jgi:hypothetical protein
LRQLEQLLVAVAQRGLVESPEVLTWRVEAAIEVEVVD